MTLWTEERTDQLKALWKGGSSASVIAAELGVSRSAVLGKVNRLGLEGRKVLIRKPVTHSDNKPRLYHKKNFGYVPMPRSAVAFEQSPELPISEQRKSFMELGPNDCRYPHGEPSSSDFFFCGSKVIEGLPYCAAHCRLAYRRPRESHPNFTYILRKRNRSTSQMLQSATIEPIDPNDLSTEQVSSPSLVPEAA